MYEWWIWALYLTIKCALSPKHWKWKRLNPQPQSSDDVLRLFFFKDWHGYKALTQTTLWSSGPVFSESFRPESITKQRLTLIWQQQKKKTQSHSLWAMCPYCPKQSTFVLFVWSHGHVTRSVMSRRWKVEAGSSRSQWHSGWRSWVGLDADRSGVTFDPVSVYMCLLKCVKTTVWSEIL